MSNVVYHKPPRQNSIKPSSPPPPGRPNVMIGWTKKCQYNLSASSDERGIIAPESIKIDITPDKTGVPIKAALSTLIDTYLEKLEGMAQEEE